MAQYQRSKEDSSYSKNCYKIGSWFPIELLTPEGGLGSGALQLDVGEVGAGVAEVGRLGEVLDSEVAETLAQHA